MVARQPYAGTSRKLVVAFDVGTTYSGVSYCLLDPGNIPEIKGITRFPSQELTRSDSKIPSILWYGPEAQVRAIGAEATCEGIEEMAQIEQWSKVEWFKLHLRPAGLGDEHTTEILKHTPPLPFGLTIITVFADFLRYLLRCTRNFIQEGSPGGALIWASIESDIEFVISHPNGWGGPQQSKLRQAAVLAGLVPDTDEGAKRIHFVTEGEASLHSCISNNLITEAMKNDGRVVVVDAGGGTIDISSYKRQTDGGKQLYEELASPLCIMQGSIFVTEHARSYFNEFLKGSEFEASIADICNSFDKTTKQRFRSAEDPGFIKFGTPRDNDAEHGISYGRLKLPGAKVAEFFKPALDSITRSIVEHLRYLRANTVFLVGGFAASDWLFHQVKDAAAPHGVEVCRPDSHVNKMVADGGVSFFIDHYVYTRVAKYDYGTELNQTYDASKPDHVQRQSSCSSWASGTLSVPGAFDVILRKNTKVTEQQVFRHLYFRQMSSIKSPAIFKDDIFFYKGSLQNPQWLDEDKEHFKVLCTIEADLTSYAASLQPRRTPLGKPYYHFSYDIILMFGLTELVAQIAWKEKGIEKRGPARIVYHD